MQGDVAMYDIHGGLVIGSTGYYDKECRRGSQVESNIAGGFIFLNRVGWKRWDKNEKSGLLSKVNALT